MNMQISNIKINRQISTIKFFVPKNALIGAGLLLLLLISCGQNKAVLPSRVPSTLATVSQTDASVQDESEQLNTTPTLSATIVEENSENESVTPTATSIPSTPVAVEESVGENDVFYLPDGCVTGPGGVSPDSKWVVYTCEEPEQTWVTRLDQKSPPILIIDGRRIWVSVTAYNFDKDFSIWSPDSQKFIAYNYSDDPILIFSVSQWDNPIAVNDVSPLNMQIPMWAPDSQKFGVVTLEDSAMIHLVTLDGKTETVAQGIDYALPAFYLTIRGWTADSNHIVYDYNPNGREQLWLLDIQSGQKELLFESDTKLTSWSPYESELVFVTSPYSLGEPTDAELFIFDINTRQSTHIAEWVLPYGMRVPKRSPDERFLALGTQNHIFIYDFNTEQFVKIENRFDNSYNFYWNPTSEYVLVEEEHKVELVSVNTQKTKKLICNPNVSFTIFHENWSDDGQSALVGVVGSDGSQHLEWVSMQIAEIDPCK